MIEKVVSGGQAGVDVAAWDAAVICGIPTGGWMPRGFLTEEGPRPEYAAIYGAREHPIASYPPRTRDNVRMADLTLVMGDVTSPGSILAFRTAAEEFLPAIGWMEGAPDRGIKVEFDCPSSRQRKWKWFPVVGSVDEAEDLILILGPRVVNVGGNRASRAPGIHDWAYRNLVDLFNRIKGA